MTTIVSQKTLTRPANTAQYAIGDMIGTATAADNLLTFNGLCGGLGRTCLITNAKLILGSAAATALSAELFLFHTAVTTVADNSANTITDAQMKTCIGSVLFNAGSVTTNQTVHVKKPNIQCKGEGSSHIYGVLIAQNTYTPESEEVIDIILTSVELT